VGITYLIVFLFDVVAFVGATTTDVEGADFKADFDAIAKSLFAMFVAGRTFVVLTTLPFVGSCALARTKAV
jgi:hypothetical protein